MLSSLTGDGGTLHRMLSSLTRDGGTLRRMLSSLTGVAVLCIECFQVSLETG